MPPAAAAEEVYDRDLILLAQVTPHVPAARTGRLSIMVTADGGTNDTEERAKLVATRNANTGGRRWWRHLVISRW